MHIAYVTETYPPELNGVALTVARTIDYLSHCGHEMEVIRPRQPDELECEMEHEWRTPGVAIPLYSDLRMGLPMLWRLKKRWQDKRPELVHVATPGPLGWAACRAAKQLDIPLTADFRTNFQQYTRYYGLGLAAPLVGAYLRNFHNGADMTFVPTQTLQEELQQKGFRNLEVIGRGVDTQTFRPTRRSDELRATWGVDEETPVLLYVGRLAPEKNVDLAFQAYAMAKRSRPDARMVVVGDGPLYETLKQAHPDVIFTGVKRGFVLGKYYASADLFLFPSLTDTFGNVVLEAMASGLPVLAYETAAAAEYVEPGVSGMLATPGNATEFLNTAYSMAGQPLSWLQNMGHAARQAAEDAQWGRVLGSFEHQLRNASSARVMHGQPCAI